MLDKLDWPIIIGESISGIIGGIMSRYKIIKELTVWQLVKNPFLS